MLKADDNEYETTTSVEKEILKTQLQSYSSPPNYSSVQNEETLNYQPQPQQQHPSPPTPSTKKTSQSNKKNPFQMHAKLNIIPKDKKDELNMQYLATLNGVLKLTEVVSKTNFLFFYTF